MSTFLADLLPLCPHTITVAPVAVRDSFGVPSSYGAAISFRGRVVTSQRRIVSMHGPSKGTEVLAVGYVIVLGLPTISDPDTRITLPSGAAPPILAWSSTPDENGALYTKIYFGAA